ncbi:hypothetical protein OROGR_034153 [Orobanche gracilis]
MMKPRPKAAAPESPSPSPSRGGDSQSQGANTNQNADATEYLCMSQADLLNKQYLCQHKALPKGDEKFISIFGDIESLIIKTGKWLHEHVGNSDYTTLFGEKMKKLSVLYEWQTIIAYSIESSVDSGPEPRDLKCFELALMEDSYEDPWNPELFYPILGEANWKKNNLPAAIKYYEKAGSDFKDKVSQIEELRKSSIEYIEKEQKAGGEQKPGKAARKNRKKNGQVKPEQELKEVAEDAPKALVSKVTYELVCLNEPGPLTGIGRVKQGTISISSSMFKATEHQMANAESFIKLCSGHLNLVSIMQFVDFGDGKCNIITEEVLTYEQFFKEEFRLLKSKTEGDPTIQMWWGHIEPKFFTFFRGVIEGIMHLRSLNICIDPNSDTYITPLGAARVLPSLELISKKNHVKDLLNMMKMVIKFPFKNNELKVKLPEELARFFSHDTTIK